MKTFAVAVTEKLIKVVDVLSETEQQATEIAKQAYFNGEIKLNSAEDFNDAYFDIMPATGQNHTYLVRFLEKGSETYNYAIVFTNTENLYNFTEQLSANDNVTDFEQPMLLPEELIEIVGNDMVLCDYTVALTLEPEWVEEHKYLWF